MFLEIVTPDEKVFEGEVESATFPGSDGSFQVLNDHAPLISTLGRGDLVYKTKITEGKDKDKLKATIIEVDGGVVEVLHNKVVVLAEAVFGD
ncbi:MAG: F0F1 ATP synthase subunit epsilon [bacterium]|jgi:F-type H+-transporting ATPase subunit epsilon|nr:F0F1 ATP synthase subunit epsilon [bacterium]